MTSPRDIAAGLWRLGGLDPAALDSLRLTGRESALPSSFRVVAAAQAAIGVAGLAAAETFRYSTGRGQGVAVDARGAAAEFRSEQYIREEGVPRGELWDPIAGVYRCADGWVRLHTNFPHHRDGILRLLGARRTRRRWPRRWPCAAREAFETEATAAGMCRAAMRSFDAWDTHPHAATVADLPLVLERIGDAPPLPFHPGAVRPLSGVRVLELTRVIAGPVAGRTLAAHGADVLHVTGPGVLNLPRLIVDTGRGKRAAELDLATDAGRASLAALTRGADVFLQSYRPGALARRGFAPEALAALRPGLVCATLSAYGEAGPWGGKRGFDSLVQTATGFNHAEAEAAGTEAEAPALPGARPRLRLPARLRHHGGVAAPVDRGRSWRVGFAGRDRPLAARAGAAGRRAGRADMTGTTSPMRWRPAAP